MVAMVTGMAAGEGKGEAGGATAVVVAGDPHHRSCMVHTARSRSGHSSSARCTMLHSLQGVRGGAAAAVAWVGWGAMRLAVGALCGGC